MRAFVALPLLLTGALLPGPGPASAVAPSPPLSGASAAVTVADNTFDPARLTVSQGTTVTWVFEDQMAHTTTSFQGFWDSGAQNAGDSFDRLFPSAGTFGYECSLHAFMTGRVTVPVTAARTDAGWRLRWAVAGAGADRDFDVQVRHAKAEKWRWFRRDATRAAGTFSPSREGRWKVRARTSNTDAGASSGWSPVVTVRVA